MIALFIVALLNINSYAAVSANDGSAFVTKAEFDALVNTFNEQMDTYQSGLNAKIDGAIANYLAGLSSTKTETRSPLAKPTNGIWSASIVSDTKPWVEGTMCVHGNLYMARHNYDDAQYRGGHSISLIGKAAQPFKEHLIDNPRNGYYKYNGYVKSEIDALVYGGAVTTSGPYYYDKYNTKDCLLGRMYWTTMSSPIAYFMSADINHNYINGGSCIRTIKETYIDTLICTPTSIDFPYFNNSNTTGANALWCYDANITTNNLHTLRPKLSEVFQQLSIYGKSNDKTVNGAFAMVDNPWDTGDMSASKVMCKPFLGFNMYCKKFEDLYVDTYSLYASDIKSKSGAATVKDEYNNDQLLIINGFPLVKASKDEVIYLPIKFDKVDGEWKNIDIWLKASAFGANEDVKSTTEADIIKPNVNDGTNLQTSVYSNAVTLNANAGTTEDTKGTGMIKFKMPKDGYVFMKWSVAGNEAKGGGTFHPQDMKVELVEK